MATQLIPTALGRVHVTVEGDPAGETIVFWPSLLMTGDMWRAQADHFGPRYRVVLVDPPGHGGSDPLTRAFTFEQCERVVVDLVDGVGAEQVHFVGNSWGGMIGATFAATHPERIGRAVLLNATATTAGLRTNLEYAVLLRTAKLLGGLRPPLTRSVLKAFLGPTTLRQRPEVVAYVREQVARVDVRSSAWAVRSVVLDRPDQRALLAGVRTPVLVVAGAEDATFSVTDSRVMADAMPGATARVLDGVAHLAALEDPVRVNALIDAFLSGRADALRPTAQPPG